MYPVHIIVIVITMSSKPSFINVGLKVPSDIYIRYCYGNKLISLNLNFECKYLILEFLGPYEPLRNSNAAGSLLALLKKVLPSLNCLVMTHSIRQTKILVHLGLGLSLTQK